MWVTEQVGLILCWLNLCSICFPRILSRSDWPEIIHLFFLDVGNAYMLLEGEKVKVLQ
jgi:hypothetical protein